MARRPATEALPLPGDIRLMNASAAVFAAIGALALFAAALVALARHPVLALRAIRIEGEVTRNSLQTIRANAVPRLAGTFFTIDLAAAKAAFEAVPWVRRAVVQRVFPGRLVVRLEEHQPAALWGTDGGGDLLVNSFGEVFQANPGDVEDDGLPALAGPAGSAARLLALHARLAPLFEPIAARVAQLELSPRGSWRATLDDGVVVELGRGGDDGDDAPVLGRTQRYVATLPEIVRRLRAQPLYADLRHRDGYALRLKGVTTETAPENKTGARN